MKQGLFVVICVKVRRQYHSRRGAAEKKRDAMDGFTITEKRSGDCSVLKCSGAIDYSNFNHGDDIVKELIERGAVKLVFDLAEVSYISSSGWTVFLGNLRAVREKGGDMALSNMAPDVKYTFKLLELDNLIDYYDTAEEAVKRMG